MSSHKNDSDNLHDVSDIIRSCIKLKEQWVELCDRAGVPKEASVREAVQLLMRGDFTGPEGGAKRKTVRRYAIQNKATGRYWMFDLAGTHIFNAASYETAAEAERVVLEEGCTLDTHRIVPVPLAYAEPTRGAGATSADAPSRRADVSELARDLYATFCASGEGKTPTGRMCPAWNFLPEEIRKHWVAVASRCNQLIFDPEAIRVQPSPADLTEQGLNIWRFYTGRRI